MAKTTKNTRPLISLREARLVRAAFEDRIRELDKLVKADTGTSWGKVWAAEIVELKMLFERLTTYPID